MDFYILLSLAAAIFLSVARFALRKSMEKRQRTNLVELRALSQQFALQSLKASAHIHEVINLVKREIARSNDSTRDDRYVVKVVESSKNIANDIDRFIVGEGAFAKALYSSGWKNQTGTIASASMLGQIVIGQSHAVKTRRHSMQVVRKIKGRTRKLGLIESPGYKIIGGIKIQKSPGMASQDAIDGMFQKQSAENIYA